MPQPLLIYAIAVFSLMFIGLVLTVLDFRYGAAYRQEKAAQAILVAEKPPKETTK